MGKERRLEVIRSVDFIWKATTTILGFLVTISMLVTGWTVGQVQNVHRSINELENRTTILETTYFAQKDAYDLKSELQELNHKINTLINSIETYHGKSKVRRKK